MAKKKQRINLIDQNGNSQVVQVNSKELYDNESKATKATKNTTVKSTVKNAVKGGLSQADKLSYAPLVTVASTVNGALGGIKDKQGHTVGENTLQVGKNLLSGTFSGATSIADSELYEARNSLQKGEKKAKETTNAIDSTKSLLKSGKEALLSSSPVTAQFVEDDNDSKGVSGALKGLKNVGDTFTGKKGFNKAIEALGETYSKYKNLKGEEGKLSNKVEKLQKEIDKPSEKYAQEIQEENQNYSKPVQVLSENAQIVGNMIPSIAMSAATKNPSAGKWALYQGAKGSATKEALQKGADLDLATSIGNASGLVEVGTEALSGGVKIKGKSIYGKGALDDVIENNVNRFVKNKAANWLVKKFGTEPLGEIAEETISDLVGTYIDKNTVDPNAKYTWKDWGHTVGMTYLSTLSINLLGGSFGKSSYNQNLQSMAETQVADIEQKVQQGLISKEEGARKIEQITQTLNNEIGSNEEVSAPEELQEALVNTNPEDIEQAASVEANAVLNKVNQGKITEQQGQELLDIIQGNAQTLLEQQQILQNDNGQMQFNLDNQQDTIESKMQLVQELNDTERAALTEVTQKLKRGEQLTDDDRAVIGVINAKQNQNVQQETVQEQQKLPVDTNDKLQNYRNSLENENIEDRDGFFKAFEKIIKDKDYNVVFDSSITNEKGQSVNAVISNENGITIKINPQSERASQILLMHEITHGIETKEIRNLIMDYAKKNSEFNDALEDLKKAYGTEDVTPEVVADISGQLFGNQEFINNLAVEKPSLFKRILDAIKELANKLTGNKDYNRFIKDLQVKWERAYRQSNIESAQQNLKEGAKYSQSSTVELNNSKSFQEKDSIINSLWNEGLKETIKSAAADPNINTYEELQDYAKRRGVSFFPSKNIEFSSLLSGEEAQQKVKGQNFVDFIESYLQERTTSPTKDKTTDNEGNKLSKGQQEYFEESKIRDENGALTKVYHTNKYTALPFFEFKPQVAGDYHDDLFDGQTVIFFTDDKVMSGSYAKLKYKMANTKRLTSIEDFEKTIDKLIEENDEEGTFSDDLSYKVDTQPDGKVRIKANGLYGEINFSKVYSSENDFLRNIMGDLLKSYGNKEKFQYEGYLNITNPFVVDAKGEYWDAVMRDVTKERKEAFKEAKKHEGELLELLEESKKVYDEFEKAGGMWKLNASKSIFEEANGISELYEEGFAAADSYETYDEFKEDAEDTYPNIKLPSSDAIMRDLVNKDKLEEIKSEYSDYSEDIDKLLNMSIGTFFEDYNTTTDIGTMYDEETYFYNNYHNIIGDEVANAMRPAVWYKIVAEGLTEDSLLRNAARDFSTNDVASLVIKENKTLLESEKYDGIVFKNVVDYGMYMDPDEETPHTVYITFNSNQFKAADNLDPTNDPDMRYSKVTDKWQKFLEKNFKNTGTTTKAKDYIKEVPKQGPALADVGKTEKKVVKQPSTDTKEFKEAQQKVKNGTATMKERKYIKTATEAQNTKNLIKDMDDVAKNYEVLANKTSMNKAKTQLSGFDTVEDKAKYISSLLTSGKRITAADITAAQLVLKDAAATKNAKLYTDVLADTSILATEYGQVLQAMSQIRKLSPTSQLDVLEKIIKREKAKGNKGYSELKITDEMRNRVLDCYDSNGNINQEKFDETMNDIKQELADKIKVGVAEKMRAWRYLSMLGNPKTHVRNIVANVAMSVVKGTKDKVSGLGQDIFVRNKANKTRTLKFASKEVKSLATQAYNEIKGETKGNKYNEESDLDNRKTIFKFKPLEKVRKWNDVALSAEDQAFKKINFKKSFANYLTAQGISTSQDIKNNPDIIEKAKQFATIEADVATFNQANKLSEFLNSADNKLGGTGKVIRGAIIPFTRTPLNIAKTGIEYTPGIGAFTTLNEWKNAPDNMKGAALIDGMSKQMTGGALALLGYVLAKAGIITAGSGDDKEDKFEKDQGSTMDYSIKIGDTSYDLSWLSPSSMPFFVGSRMFEVLDKQEGINENLIVESLASTLDPLSEMSVVQSFTDVLSSYSQEGTGKIKDMAVSTMQSYLSQYIPTLAGQFARFFDDTKRTTMADTGSSHKISQETARKLQYKIPGARNLLPESTDYYGRDKKEYNEGLIGKATGNSNNIVDRIYNSFLSPVNKRKDTMTEEDKEIIRLYNKTGNEDIIPYAMKQNVQFNDNNYQMTRKEYNKYKKDFGDAYTENVKSLMKTYSYKTASDDEKAQMIAGIMSYAKDKTKDNYLTGKGEDYVKISEKGEKTPYESDKVDEIIGNKYGIYDYYAYKVNAPNVVSGKVEAQKTKLNFARTFGISPKTYSKFLEDVGDMSADVDENGKTIQNSKKKKVYNYINSMNLSGEQKTALFKQKYKEKSTNSAYYNKINDSDLTVEEKESLAKFLKIK